jgi:ABC transporter with metal-binding/Fe-S-binding domain ATP-binding protein
MNVAVLFSGGKDSCLALHKAQEKGHQVCCLISMLSKNKESYMFHTPNIDLTLLQAEAMDIPILQVETEGEKEEELNDLRHAIAQAKEDMHIEGVVTGAVASTYQARRVQRICDDLDLWCFNPLWQVDQLSLLQELLNKQFDVRIVGVFAYPLDESWLGKKIDARIIDELDALQQQYQIHPAGEGGEFETLVVDAPMFQKRILLQETNAQFENHAGVLMITRAELEEK